MSGQGFPSLVLKRDGVVAQGAFAEAQAAYLEPDPDAVSELRSLLERTRGGVVAHFYMDAELQGALYACDWPHIHVSDSLMMADAAIDMARAGARNVVVLGVDFMSENVRAMLDASGFEDVAVYRVATDPIGCSLAESAESLAYAAWLDKAAERPHAIHVVYINTSLRTKAHAHRKVPTITCTSSNVVKTVLQAAAQDPEVEVFFGPDTYMGANLAELFARLSHMDPAVIRELHPDHTPTTVAALAERFHYFAQGNCIVHHMFGEDVVARVRADYPEAMVTAHLEVPGEMFALGLERQHEGRGVVGSTSNILDFITAQTKAAIDAGQPTRLPFVLGTEAGMVTAIVRKVRQLLEGPDNPGVEVEIIFPVASEAVATTADESLPLVPGVAGGEGCSTAGGCATCPYMKMNSFDALIDVFQTIADASGPAQMQGFEPRKYEERLGGRSVAEVGGEPILHMRTFQKTGRLPDALMSGVSR